MVSSDGASAMVVDLNVGGTPFSTSLQTLRSRPDTMLGRMMTSGTPVLRDGAGRVFLDRNPAVFGAVLDWLRDGDCDIVRRGTARERAALLREAEYFMLDDLVDALHGGRGGGGEAAAASGSGLRGGLLAACEASWEGAVGDHIRALARVAHDLMVSEGPEDLLKPPELGSLSVEHRTSLETAGAFAAAVRYTATCGSRPGTVTLRGGAVTVDRTAKCVQFHEGPDLSSDTHSFGGGGLSPDRSDIYVLIDGPGGTSGLPLQQELHKQRMPLLELHRRGSTAAHAFIARLFAEHELEYRVHPAPDQNNSAHRGASILTLTPLAPVEW